MNAWEKLLAQFERVYTRPVDLVGVLVRFRHHDRTWRGRVARVDVNGDPERVIIHAEGLTNAISRKWTEVHPYKGRIASVLEQLAAIEED